jgi:hypothetical protein
MSYKTSPFLSSIFVEKPSLLTILSGEGRLKAKRGMAIKEITNKTATPRKAYLDHRAIFLLLLTLCERKLDVRLDLLLFRVRFQFAIMYSYCSKILHIIKLTGFDQVSIAG